MSKIQTHYDNLKVSRDAPDFVIRAAYKTLTQKYHPDKQPGDEYAARLMTTINTSYEVLSDTKRRAEHDAWIVREELRLARQAPHPPGGTPIPPHWQQPVPTQAPASGTRRPGLFARVVGGLLSVVLASPRLLLLGILSSTIFLLHRYPGKPAPPPSPKPYQADAPASPVSAGVSNCRAISYSYKSGGKDVSKEVYSYDSAGTRHFTSRKPAGCDSTVQPARPAAMIDSAAYIRPAAAPNGNPWPVKAAYVGGYPIDHDDGYSKVTVDNGRSDSDVFVKLVSLDDDTAFPVRQFFIPAHSRFTLNKVSAGRYDIRYRDLGSGGLSRSEAFDVEEIDSGDSAQFSDITLTLYKVQGGNFQTYGLVDSEF